MGRTPQPKDEVAFPVARHRTIFDAGRPLADEDLRRYERLATAAHALPGHAQGSPGAQAGSQLATKGPATLHVQRLVDRLMADAHRSVFREVGQQAIRDLFRAPRPRPSAGLPASMSTPLPLNLGPSDGSPAWCGDIAGQSILHVLQQDRIRHQFGRLGTLCGEVGMPLRCVGPVLEAAAARGRVAPQLTRDRRRRSSQLSGDRSNALSASARQRDLFTLSEGNVAA